MVDPDIIATATNTSEQDPHQYYAEASDLRMKPGFWPDAIGTTLGNGQPFTVSDDTGERVCGVIYRQNGTGAMLTVFND